MATADQTVAIAESFIGYNRYSDPEQGTIFGRWYAKQMGSSYYGQNGVPYCAMFVSYVLNQAGVRCEGFPSPSAFSGSERFNGRRVESDSLVVGDIANFDWDDDNAGDHVGFVRLVVSRGIYRTVEGNVDGGQVKECTRYASQILQGVRPYYEGASKTSRVIVDGIIGPASVRELQRQLGSTQDGVISGQRVDHDKYRRSVSAIDYVGAGSAVVLRMQRKVNAYEDGDWGKNTTIHVQQALKRWGYYKGGIDGDFGPASAQALQRSMNDLRWS